jgi:ABC-type multidrug transport system ATPase subunit
MTISLADAGKRFNRDWIFRHLTYTFHTGNSYAVVGPNGSGKSTLLQAIGGAIALSEGYLTAHSSRFAVPGSQQPLITNQQSSNHTSTDQLHQSISIAAPYLDVIEEMTATEFLQFHQTFKPFLTGFTVKKIIAKVSLDTAANKQIRYYSSGMKQRIKLAQAIFSDTPVVLLDEPCTNLDADGIALYHRLINDHCKDRLVIISSNDEVEYGFCKERLSITDWK